MKKTKKVNSKAPKTEEEKMLFNASPWIVVFILLAVGAAALMYMDIKRDMEEVREDILYQMIKTRD